jgi:hypothetical protein
MMTLAEVSQSTLPVGGVNGELADELAKQD